MTIRFIVQSTESSLSIPASPRLRELTNEVDASSLSAARLVAEDLLDTMKSQPLCVGLAANQIDQDARIAVIQRDDNSPLVLLNPTIVSTAGKKDKKRESCMSVWGLTAEVERRSKVTVSYQDLDLTPHEETFEGFEARVVQHEIDHLNGVLYLDIANTPGRPTQLFDGHSPHTNADGVP